LNNFKLLNIIDSTGLRAGSVPFEHGSIGHHQPQQPVPRGFPLFKRYEWLVFNWFVSKRKPSLRVYWSPVLDIPKSMVQCDWL